MNKISKMRNYLLYHPLKTIAYRAMDTVNRLRINNVRRSRVRSKGAHTSPNLQSL